MLIEKTFELGSGWLTDPQIRKLHEVLKPIEKIELEVKQKDFTQTLSIYSETDLNCDEIFELGMLVGHLLHP